MLPAGSGLSGRSRRRYSVPLFYRLPDVPGGLHGIRMGRIHTEVSPLQQGGHLLRGQPPAVDGDAGPFALFLGPQRGGHTDQYLGPQCGQLL